ncbi:long-chain-fatty-acid-CoA ligase [Cantharellus anzutake]|uniref:long-chain-fatty-acid-CoA ligase n=1 Tax=Cantharellus anzutake TaxID=1750568 RepID=UPI0019076DAA|nr:long-chain-fatty-acid-CoA ligase [Cantharellus anzutake]KAF8332328.1 long-chain-fatty-acid-CoA ligase [Cantharellus anzutake]
MVHKCEAIPFPEGTDYNKLAFELPGTRKLGQTAVWPELITPENQPIQNLQDVFNSGMLHGANNRCLGWRKLISKNPVKFAPTYSWLTFNEVDQRRRYIGSAITQWFQDGKLVKGDQGYEAVGIWSINRPEWQLVDLACQAYAKVSVSLYDTLGPDSVEYIVNHATLSVIFCAPEKVPELLRLAHRLPALRKIVSFDNLGDQAKPLLRAWGKDRGVEVLELEEVEALGKAHNLPLIPVTPNTIATICYTSGTTGNPKGALLTHGGLAVSIWANLHGMLHHPDGPLLSYLPLAHIYARFAELLSIAMGGPIGYFSGDNLRLLEDAQILKPVYFPSVPRVLNKVYAGASAALANGGIKAYLLSKAIDAKQQRLFATGSRVHPLWDGLVFRKIRSLLGGHVGMISSGSAPISGEVLTFLKVAFSAEVVEGYGMTENCGTCLRGAPPDHFGVGTCGPPQPCNEVKLIDVPEMGYTSQDKPYPRGELCTRGWNNTLGYYKDPENTKKTIDSEGWLHTGDVASIDSAGRVAIIDRVKNIMKLSQGEYVALEKVENIYSTVPLLQTTFVYGDSLRDHLVGVVVPDPIAITDLAARLGLGKKDPTDRNALDGLITLPQIKKEILDNMNAVARERGLKGFETVKLVHITNEPFTPENGTLTPTFKIKRKETALKFKKELDALYAESAKLAPPPKL